VPETPNPASAKSSTPNPARTPRGDTPNVDNKFAKYTTHASRVPAGNRTLSAAAATTPGNKTLSTGPATTGIAGWGATGNRTGATISIASLAADARSSALSPSTSDSGGVPQPPRNPSGAVAPVADSAAPVVVSAGEGPNAWATSCNVDPIARASPDGWEYCR
jgi:hypothetical protein